MDSPEDERTKLVSCLGAFRQYWSSLPQESHDQCVQWIVRFIHSQHSPKRIAFLYDCLAMAVETSLLPPRMVCQALISSDSLEWERTQLWALTFKLIRKIIGGVDYKGVRDLLKAVLDKIQTVPNFVSSAVVQQLLAAREVVEYILDRNACLLPAYFAVTEIRKLYPEGALSHWLLGSLISDFVDSFRPTARINSICGRCSLLPVVNNSGAICNSWKLDPTTLRFPLRGMLPYDKDLFDPQTGLLRYVLEQPYSRDMVCNMLGLNKQVSAMTLSLALSPSSASHVHPLLCDERLTEVERSGACSMSSPTLPQEVNDSGPHCFVFSAWPASTILPAKLAKFLNEPPPLLGVPVLARSASPGRRLLPSARPRWLCLLSGREYRPTCPSRTCLWGGGAVQCVFCWCLWLCLGVVCCSVQMVHSHMQGNTAPSAQTHLTVIHLYSHKQRCPVLEDQLVDLVVYAMERSETEEQFDDGGTSQLLWQHLSSQLIFFVLFQFASFPHMVLSLHQKLAGRGLIKGRDHLMWVLLQFISGSIQKNALADFLPVMKLFDLLYPEKESTHAFAMTCIWIHLNRKAQNDNSKLQIPIPHSLKLHHEFLQQSLRNKSLPMTDYKIALLCNAYSTNSECFTLPMGVLVETIYGNGSMRITLPGTNCMASGSVTPLPMNLLDSLTVHAKMSLIHSIATRVIKLAHAKSSLALAPALVETYSRLLVYMEIESLGIKGFISQLLPNVFKSHAWGILHTLLEMFSYRMHHIQPHYRVQLLVESTALRLITALGSSEVQPQFTRFLNDPKTVLSAESEELNRALILTLARATHVTDFFTGSDSIQGTWCKDILQTIMNFTPHNWASHTLSCFPAPLQNNVPQESRFNLKKNVEEEYRKWKSMTVENDIITHFSMQGSPPLFLCLLWKMLLETDHINQIGFRKSPSLFKMVTLSVSTATFSGVSKLGFSWFHRILLDVPPIIHLEMTENEVFYFDFKLFFSISVCLCGLMSSEAAAALGRIKAACAGLNGAVRPATRVIHFIIQSRALPHYTAGAAAADVFKGFLTILPLSQSNQGLQDTHATSAEDITRSLLTCFFLSVFLDSCCFLFSLLYLCRVLERIGARALVAHVRTFADFLVYEFSTSAGGQQLNKCIEILNDMVWKYNIVTLDRLILCLAMRSHEGNEAQVCYFIIQLLLLKPNDFRNRILRALQQSSSHRCRLVMDLCLILFLTFSDETISVQDIRLNIKLDGCLKCHEHRVIIPLPIFTSLWHFKERLTSDCLDISSLKYPEKLYFEGLAEQVNPPIQLHLQYLPIYFGNVCLRFLPVFDIVIHRFLELLPVSKSLETLLDHLGGLYKFHDRPVTYLYNTLHYYERHLRDRTNLKRKLVHAIMSSLKDNRTPGWCLSETYLKCGMNPRDDNVWIPDDTYYCKLIGRLIQSKCTQWMLSHVECGKSPGPFPNCDWRFNEFPNPAAHALHVTCVELMALAVPGKDVGNALLNVVLKSQPLVPRENITAWMNAIGLVITALPEPYWIVLHDRIVSVISSPVLSSEMEWVGYPFQLLDFTACHRSYSEMHCSYILALAHAVWHHSSIGQLSLIPKSVHLLPPHALHPTTTQHITIHPQRRHQCEQYEHASVLESVIHMCVSYDRMTPAHILTRPSDTPSAATGAHSPPPRLIKRPNLCPRVSLNPRSCCVRSLSSDVTHLKTICCHLFACTETHEFQADRSAPLSQDDVIRCEQIFIKHLLFLSEVLKPIVKTEFQLLYVYHLVGPFLQRFQQERTRCMLEIGVAFYEMLQAVDQHSKHLAYMDPICDFLYHIKYMFTGDSVKDQVERIICSLRPAMRLRLRFITHISKMEPAAAAAASTATSVPQSTSVSERLRPRWTQLLTAPDLKTASNQLRADGKACADDVI
ncbi:Mediator of RNA polymerase II transcription subunit 23 [Labeo rohita]|uniref:Mediator of RNA polymerase II transcription subunit 23 n=2 Tax=Labeonini TaxID=2743697 RepID=A0ABQ8LR25_LABRO|nr:Mediator of RNA polymerase II transcription subunit 23 [Labeo rohita]